MQRYLALMQFISPFSGKAASKSATHFIKCLHSVFHIPVSIVTVSEL
jgi:hypothetical protein